MGRYVKINNELVPTAGIGGGGQDNTFRSENLSDWEALTQEEKDQYDSVDIWGDYTDVTEELESMANKLTSLTKGTMRRVGIISPLNGWTVIQFPPCNTVTLNGVSLYGLSGDHTNEFSIVGTDRTQGIMILSCSNSAYYNYFAAVDITLT